MADDKISFGSTDMEIAKHLPGYTLERINEAFTELIADNEEYDRMIEVDEDFYDGY